MPTPSLTGNAYVTDGVLKKAGKVVQITHNVLAKDAKSFTLTIANPAKTATTIEVFEKVQQTAPMLYPPVSK